MDDSVVSDLGSLELGLPGAVSLNLNGSEPGTEPPRPRPRPPSPKPEDVENATSVLLVAFEIVGFGILIPMLPLIDTVKQMLNWKSQRGFSSMNLMPQKRYTTKFK
ncbi:hypothetical protein V8G54_034444 [Vigna mungo]|uniref:Uncharacterized protein n=1 Tax=Vigna mungo TaxID=3915 RepID=A0AAQ3MQN6_VIGMU